MPHRSTQTAVYAEDVTKIEITIPDDLLPRIDDAAKRADESRDEFIQRVAEREIVEANARLRKELEEMMPPPMRGGGESGRWIREDRDHRDDRRFGRVGKDD